MNFKKWRHIFLIGVAVVFAAQTAVFAASSLSFGTLVGPNNTPLTAAQILAPTSNLPSGLLEGFWQDVSGSSPGDSSQALKIASSVNTFNTNPASLISDVPPATTKYLAYENSTPGYYFWRFADENAPGATVYVRIWSDNSKTYYMYDSFANGFGSDTPHTTSISAGSWYKAAAPDTPLITQFDEVSTTPVVNGVNGAKTGTLKITSSAAPVHDGMRQVTQYIWMMSTAINQLTQVSGANSSVLTLDEASLKVGTTYYFRVSYRNWFGTTVSAVQSYTVSGATGTTTPPPFAPITYPLTSAGLGLNVVSIDFDTTKGPITALDSTGNTITVVDPTIGQVLDVKTLINEINRQAGAAIVKTIGYYDNTLKKQVGLSSVAATLANSTAVGDTTANILAHQIKEPLQISVSADKSIVLNGTK